MSFYLYQDIFLLLPGSQIRRLREEAPSNFATLLYKVAYDDLDDDDDDDDDADDDGEYDDDDDDDNFDTQAILLLCAAVSVSAELLVGNRILAHFRSVIFAPPFSLGHFYFSIFAWPI